MLTIYLIKFIPSSPPSPLLFPPTRLLSAFMSNGASSSSSSVAQSADNVTGPCLIRCGSHVPDTAWRHSSAPLVITGVEREKGEGEEGETLNWKVGKIIRNKFEIALISFSSSSSSFSSSFSSHRG